MDSVDYYSPVPQGQGMIDDLLLVNKRYTQERKKNDLESYQLVLWVDFWWLMVGLCTVCGFIDMKLGTFRLFESLVLLLLECIFHTTHLVVACVIRRWRSRFSSSCAYYSCLSLVVLCAIRNNISRSCAQVYRKVYIHTYIDISHLSTMGWIKKNTHSDLVAIVNKIWYAVSKLKAYSRHL